MNFGEMMKELRTAQGKTLRRFCDEHGQDPSNWSKIERGVNPPPRDSATLARWARQLGLKPDTDAWRDFMMQADLSRGEIPKNVLADEQLMAKLPVFFRTVQGAEMGDVELDDLIRKIKEAHTPDEHSGEKTRE